MEARYGHHDSAGSDPVGYAMTRETRHLLAALAAINQQIPNVALRMLEESMSWQRQLEFGDLLIELGRAMHEHADHSRCATGSEHGTLGYQRDLGHSYGA